MVTLAALGTPPDLVWLIAFLGTILVGVPSVCRARVAALVACLAVLTVGAGFGAISRQAEADARRYVAEHPPPVTTTTPPVTWTWVVLPAGASCDAYPYSTYDACNQATQEEQ